MKIIEKIDDRFKNFQTNKPEYLVIHHAKGPAKQTFEIIRDYHVKHRNFDTIGYQYLITSDGLIYQGRPDSMHGAHTREQQMNKRSLGICMTGDFDVHMPTIEQIVSLQELLKAKMKQYNIPLERIVPHRKFTNYKSCFGNNLSDDWAKNLASSNGEIPEPPKIPTSLVEKLYALLKKLGLIK